MFCRVLSAFVIKIYREKNRVAPLPNICKIFYPPITTMFKYLKATVLTIEGFSLSSYLKKFDLIKNFVTFLQNSPVVLT